MDPITFELTNNTRCTLTRLSGHRRAVLTVELMTAPGVWAVRNSITLDERRLTDLSHALAQYRLRFGLTL
jgi:hypothetical protein